MTHPQQTTREVLEQCVQALERMHLWADSQADAQSKGGHATFDLMQLREERDGMVPALTAGRAALAHPTPSTTGEAATPIELQGIKETVADGDGFWRSCTGCHETNDGHPSNGAYFSTTFNCHLGSGCSECGGIGAIWDNTDYEDMANFMIAQDATPAQVEPAPSTAGEREEVAAELLELVDLHAHARDVVERAAALLQSTALPVGELTDEQISEIWESHVIPVFGRNGINPIVFARKLLAAASSQPVREPLGPWNSRQVERMYRNSPELHKDVKTLAAFTRVARAIEAAHGITKKGAQ